MKTKLKISNVNFINKYNGAYAKIFSILNEDRIFSEIYETEDSKGLIDNNYFLELSENIENNMLEKILKIKNVTIEK